MLDLPTSKIVQPLECEIGNKTVSVLVLHVCTNSTGYIRKAYTIIMYLPFKS